jgi:hypothetical protein
MWEKRGFGPSVSMEARLYNLRNIYTLCLPIDPLLEYELECIFLLRIRSYARYSSSIGMFTRALTLDIDIVMTVNITSDNRAYVCRLYCTVYYQNNVIICY